MSPDNISTIQWNDETWSVRDMQDGTVVLHATSSNTQTCIDKTELDELIDKGAKFYCYDGSIYLTPKQIEKAIKENKKRENAVRQERMKELESRICFEMQSSLGTGLKMLMVMVKAGLIKKGELYLKDKEQKMRLINKYLDLPDWERLQALYKAKELVSTV